MTAKQRLAELRAGFERPRPALRLLVGDGGCGRARGSLEVLAALRRAVAERGLETEVVAGACGGRCHAQVLVTVQRGDAPPTTYGQVRSEAAERLLDDGTRAELTSVDQDDWLDGQRRLLSRDFGLIDPSDLGDYLRGSGYAMLARALDELAPDDLIGEVRAAGLIGRGGAYFPTAIKWQSARAASGEPKWLVVNAEEGEPGVFKDRHLLEGDPHRVIEGTLLAAYATGASQAIIYVNGEAHLAQQRLAAALEQARARGLVGSEILGSRFSLEVQTRAGGGGYILGEETALMESIEGRRAMPRVRPPFPTERGLWGKPTVINNAETLAAVRSILELGGAEFARIGRPEATGTKLIGLSGNVARPGLYEVEFGTTMRQVVEGIGGGVPDGRALKAVLIGGPSGVFVPAAALDEPILPRGGVPPGTGGWMVLDDRQSIAAATQQMTEYNMLESCGKCTPCREGTVRLVHLLDRVVEGRADAADLQQIRDLNEVLEFASLCGLGQLAARPIASALEHFSEEFQAARPPDNGRAGDPGRIP